MAVQSMKVQRFGLRKTLIWLLGIISFGGLALLLLQLVIQFMTPVPLRRLAYVQDVPLPSIIVPSQGQSVAIQSVHSDRFDFQALDTETGLLFIAHPGPSEAKLSLAQDSLPKGTTFRPNIVVFDVRHNKYVGSIDVPFVHGITIAPDLRKVYAADADVKGGKIVVIDEMKRTIIKQINASQTPDSLEYDQDTQEVFVSEQGAKLPPNGVEDVINAQNDSVINTINLGVTVGHVRYDHSSGRVFVAVVTNKDSELWTIDPVFLNITSRVPLPSTCTSAHGLALDSVQQIAFIACVDSNNVVMVDLNRLRVIGDGQKLQSVGSKADILVIDHKLHLLYVGSASAVSIFNESRAHNGVLIPLGDYNVSTESSHTIAVDDTSGNVYVPLTDVGGRPTMRIIHFNPNAK